MSNDEKKHSVYMEKSLWRRVQKKAGKHRVSSVIRTLLIMWLEGEIKLEIEDLK